MTESGTSSGPRIAHLRLNEVRGSPQLKEPFWEDRLLMPNDIYPEHFAQRTEADAAFWMSTAIWVELETADGAVGRAGPIDRSQAFIIDQELRPFVEGADAMAHELLWDRLYRAQIHGRKGHAMMAISAIDCAMWDLKGRLLGMPVHQILGGPTRPSVPAYASALGFSVAPDRAAAQAREFVAQGYGAMKWFYVNGPAQGRAGMQRNEDLVAAVRAAVGPDVEIMTDAWSSWDVPYTLEMARRLVPYRPRWIEEPVLADRIDSYAAIRRQSPVPIAGGEHEYTRFGVHALLGAGGVDVLQTDILWAGGITEMLKICAIASAYDVPVIPHGSSTQANMHLIASQPEPLMPLCEYLVKWNEVLQYFLADQLMPTNGRIAVPTTPGLGMDLDESKIEGRRELRWS